MKSELDYIRDIGEMRSMMERTTKFLSLSGLAGVIAGIYAIAGTLIVYKVFDYNPGATGSANITGAPNADFRKVVFLALIILVLAIATAMYLSFRKAAKAGEKFWNATARRLLLNMAVPLVAGGLVLIILIARGFIAFVIPFSLLFYGFALYNASKFTYEEVRSLGLIQIFLGLSSLVFPEYGLLFWGLGFGVFHIIYGVYMHYRYER